MKKYFIDRTEAGGIDNLYSRPQYDGQESLLEDNQEIIDYFIAQKADPTDEEIYIQTMQNNKLIKALALSLNSAGAFSAPGDILSNIALKTLVKSNM